MKVLFVGVFLFWTPASNLMAGASVQFLASGDKIESSYDTVTEVLRLKNVRASELFPLVQTMLTNSVDLQGNQRIIGFVEVNEAINALIVTELAKKVANIRSVVKDLDEKGYEGFPLMETKTFSMNYAKASEVLPEIDKRLTGKGLASAVDDQHLIIVRDVPSNLRYIEGIIAKLDILRNQVRIRGKIVEVLDGDALDWGIAGDLSFSKDKVLINPSLSASSLLAEGGQLRTSKIGKLTFDARLDFLARDGKAKVVSNFDLSVLDNERGTLSVNDTSSLPGATGPGALGSTGISLSVNPRVNENDLLTMSLVATVNGLNLDPVTNQVAASQSRAETEVIVPFGQEFILGGLTRHRIRKTRAGIPLLKEIPLLGLLFSRVHHHTSQTQVVILFFTEKIVYPSKGDKP